jgi:hypothetical protein
MNSKTSIGIRFFGLIIAAASAWFLCLPTTQAVSPAPDGGYPGNNTAEGTLALFTLTSGADNTGLGYQALYHNTTGNYNTGDGFRALFSNTNGTQNTATGVNALAINATGSYNTANGTNALYSNTNSYNTADGYAALFHNTSGFDNTGIGDEALFTNSNGFSNTAIGGEALFENIDGSNNTAAGREALRHNTHAQGNTAFGSAALQNNTAGTFNTALGFAAGSNLSTGNNNIDIGYNVTGVVGESNTIRIGDTDITDTYIRGISGVTISGGAAVYVNSNGKLGTITSSIRFKDDVKLMDKSSESILSLKPVTFRYKKELDPNRIIQFGLVAEEVEKVNPDLVARDEQGKAYTVRYEAINAMLLNEFLKEHEIVAEQQRTIAKLNSDFQIVSAQQQRAIELLSGQVKEQASLIQKVSAQLVAARPSASKSEQQLALNR